MMRGLNQKAIEDAIAFNIESLKRKDDTFPHERIFRKGLEEVAQQVEQELKAQDDAIEAADTVDETRTNTLRASKNGRGECIWSCQTEP